MGKVISAAWVKNTYGQWRLLIEAAEAWEYGKTMLFKQANFSRGIDY
ncbi:hypothetical protein BN59_01640 [Legionella massiliensis]|uniref:Uncharacterized protein n=1 Tax=Legionella massiliensis TaxID=1034943 RepID=A0A078KWI7_9GAMM|nr:hypothetical protein [Legionella massiliensis]CDZ77357.1 hypothetical protein BN59_01640 [Legionella massiliensis]CEE13095.1 hypothetical protein BN1094_01640 [Legionella massiliensis]